VALRLGRPRRFWADVDGSAAVGRAVCLARGGSAICAWRNKAAVSGRVRARQPIGAAMLETHILQPVEVAQQFHGRRAAGAKAPGSVAPPLGSKRLVSNQCRWSLHDAK
jgi:hypothetical protein